MARNLKDERDARSETFVELTSVEFAEICRRNPEARLELDPLGRLVIVPPAATEGGGRNAQFTYEIVAWARLNGGKAFDSSTGFTLPNGAVRSPDVSWMSSAKWDVLTPEQRRQFSAVVPDFVAELRSPSDRMIDLRAKMSEYSSCGVRLAWLIDPDSMAVEVYRPGLPVERLERPDNLSGEDLLPGLTVDLSALW